MSFSVLPPSRTSDYPDDVRVAALNWNGEGSFLFTSSSAPYDCNDNSPYRGAHVYWLLKGTVEANPDHVLNPIHYEDAASLSVAILRKRLRNRILLGCDNHPLFHCPGSSLYIIRCPSKLLVVLT
ncbi:hypothetical protein RchiOBHm_Chr4g0421071 [Rosa chinensis]|uniref:Uncharacterized protein n=1 Tax=Rosa chinensis TaxID=74649 RepID=A0A2P6QY28_ROSCH|nr:hypothetical protein RchiOBHm_Chr4g0421071 [Rosa chinensis]